MKRLFLILVSAMIGFLSLSAQKKDMFKNRLYIGAGGGAYAAKLDFRPSIPQTFKIDYHGGLSLKYITQEHLGLLIELNYARRGWKEEFEEEPNFSYSRNLDYIEVPFMTHAYFGDRVRFIINVGPQVGFLLNDKQVMSEALAVDLAGRQEADPEALIGVQYGPFSELNRVDYGLVGGLGLEIQTGIGIIDLEGRYYFGLGDLFKRSGQGDNAYFSRSAHRLIEAKLTYYLQIR